MTPPQIDLSAVAPIGFTALGALVVLMAEVILSRRQHLLGRPVTDVWIGTLLATVSMLFLGLAVYTAGQAFLMDTQAVFNASRPMLQLDRLSAFVTVLVAVAALLVCLLSVTYLAEVDINHGEYYALLLLATAGMMLLVASTDLITLFLGLELMSIPIYVLAGFDRRRLRSNESALKYFVVGSFASGILLYGMALLYGTTGHTDYEGIRAAFPGGNPLALTGLGLLVVGFAFKISSVPFHQWTPDVYEGAPVSVTAYMAVTVKVAAFAALLRVLASAFDSPSEELVGLLWVLAAATMIVGNVMAVIQDNLKRLLAYSSIAHAGYVLVGLVAGTAEGHAAVLFYLLVYVFMNLGAFGVIVALANRGRDAEQIDDLAGLAQSRPALAALMTLFLVSLAGIPGTGGFIAKFMVFKAAIGAGYVGLAILGVLASVVSVYYYLRIPVAMYMSEPGEAALRQESSSGEQLVLVVCAVVVILLGIFPGAGPGFMGRIRALEWARESVALLF